MERAAFRHVGRVPQHRVAEIRRRLDVGGIDLAVVAWMTRGLKGSYSTPMLPEG
jgi:hypothetical protein